LGEGENGPWSDKRITKKRKGREKSGQGTKIRGKKLLSIGAGGGAKQWGEVVKLYQKKRRKKRVRKDKKEQKGGKLKAIGKKRQR